MMLVHQIWAGLVLGSPPMAPGAGAWAGERRIGDRAELSHWRPIRSKHDRDPHKHGQQGSEVEYEVFVMFLVKVSDPFNRDSPDESQTGINVRVFPALLQDGREVLTATSTSGNPNAWSRVDLAVFPGIWAHSFCRLLLNE